MIAVAGATGYIGGLLCEQLRESGEEVAALARHPERAGGLAKLGCDVRESDVLDRPSLDRALDGAEVAYYLVHSMGRGAEDADYANRDRQGAENFAAAAAAAGVRRIVYLGGLGEGSEHLTSRHATAEALREGPVPVAYFRAAAVIGAGSESFRTVFFLVRRLPVMVTPRWVTTRTQPIAVGDAVGFLADARDLALPLDRELQIGGPDVTTYGGMIDELARALDRRPPLPGHRAGADPGPLLALDRSGHAGRRRGRPAPDRGTRDRDRGHRSERHGAAARPPPHAAAGGAASSGGKRNCSFIRLSCLMKKPLVL